MNFSKGRMPQNGTKLRKADGGDIKDVVTRANLHALSIVEINRVIVSM